MRISTVLFLPCLGLVAVCVSPLDWNTTQFRAHIDQILEDTAATGALCGMHCEEKGKYEATALRKFMDAGGRALIINDSLNLCLKNSQVSRNAVFLPVCSGGRSRSQIMHDLLIESGLSSERAMGTRYYLWNNTFLLYNECEVLTSAGGELQRLGLRDLQDCRAKSLHMRRSKSGLYHQAFVKHQAPRWGIGDKMHNRTADIMSTCEPGREGKLGWVMNCAKASPLLLRRYFGDLPKDKMGDSNNSTTLVYMTFTGVVADVLNMLLKYNNPSTLRSVVVVVFAGEEALDRSWVVPNENQKVAELRALKKSFRIRLS